MTPPRKGDWIHVESVEDSCLCQFDAAESHDALLLQDFGVGDVDAWAPSDGHTTYYTVLSLRDLGEGRWGVRFERDGHTCPFGGDEKGFYTAVVTVLGAAVPIGNPTPSRCEHDDCRKKVAWRVSDGPEGLSPEVNVYYLCDAHGRAVMFRFEHCRPVKEIDSGA